MKKFLLAAAIAAAAAPVAAETVGVLAPSAPLPPANLREVFTLPPSEPAPANSIVAGVIPGLEAAVAAKAAEVASLKASLVLASLNPDGRQQVSSLLTEEGKRMAAHAAKFPEAAKRRLKAAEADLAALKGALAALRKQAATN